MLTRFKDFNDYYNVANGYDNSFYPDNQFNP